MPAMLFAEQIARVCYETNRAYCMATGDHSLVPWDSAPGWHHQSSIDGVEALLANPEMTPEDQHAAWLAAKKKQGWKHGPAKIPEKLEHPCMLPYADLPSKQQAKNGLFQAVVRALVPYTEQSPAPAPPSDAEEIKPAKKTTRRKRAKRDGPPDK